METSHFPSLTLISDEHMCNVYHHHRTVSSALLALEWGCRRPEGSHGSVSHLRQTVTILPLIRLDMD